MDVLKNGNTALTVDEEGQVLSAITGRAVKKIEYGDDGAFILNAVTGRAEYFIPGASGGGGGGGTFYKCASVDTATLTWTGFKAVLTDGVYTFEETATAGLTYGVAYTPAVGSIYNSGATIRVAKLWDGARYDEYTVAFWDFEEGVTSAGAVRAPLELNDAVVDGSAKFGDKALSLAPQTGYARVTMPEFDRTKDYTVDFWARVQPFSYRFMLYLNNPVNGAFSPSTNDKLMAVYCDTGNLYFHGGDYGGENMMYDMETSVLVNGNYHHIAIVRRSGRMKFAMDGHFSEVELDDACPNLNNVPIHFGWDLNSWGRHNGLVIDNLRFSSKARWTTDFNPEQENN